jgi:uncharacterized ferritin-like protein (DUF455 family)
MKKRDKSNLDAMIINDESSLNYWAVKVLCTSDPIEKANLTHSIAEKWHKNELKENAGNYQLPEQPYRQENLSFIDPAKIKRGKGGTLVRKI